MAAPFGRCLFLAATRLIDRVYVVTRKTVLHESSLGGGHRPAPARGHLPARLEAETCGCMPGDCASCVWRSPLIGLLAANERGERQALLPTPPPPRRSQDTLGAQRPKQRPVLSYCKLPRFRELSQTTALLSNFPMRRTSRLQNSGG